MAAATESRADVFAKTLTAREEQAVSLREAITDAHREEEDSLAAQIRKNPSRRVFADIDSAASKARRKREELERELADVEAELSILREEAINAGREAVEALVVAKAQELREVEATQPATWEQMQSIFSDLIGLYVKERSRVARERSRINSEVLEACGSYGALRAEWEQTFAAQQVRELPSSLPNALKALERDAFLNRELAQMLADRPEAWVPSYVGQDG